MVLIKDSFFVNLILAFAAVLQNTWRGSRTAALAHRLEAWCERTWKGSAFIGFLTREGTLSASWPASLSCRLLGWLVNLPASILHWIYARQRPYFDGSFFAVLAFDMGESTAIAVSWLMALMLSIPFERWNNAYSLMGFTACLLLMMAGGMRRESFRLNVKALGPYSVLCAAAVCLAVVFTSIPRTTTTTKAKEALFSSARETRDDESPPPNNINK